MSDSLAATHVALADSLTKLWADQGREGFLLTDPADVNIPVREALDPDCGVAYRFLWMPHREIRGDVAQLERRGILNPDRDASKLFCDPRDPQGRHCFLCAENIAHCHPKEVLVPIKLAGRDYFAGANFAWIEPDHFTLMAAEHVDQSYSQHVLDAMLDFHMKTAGRFRVLFNGCGAGASIPWHLHYQITTAAMPIERLQPGLEEGYPTAVYRFDIAGQPVGSDGFAPASGLGRAHVAVQRWLERDPEHHSVNILIATITDQSVGKGQPVGTAGPSIFVFPRDGRYATAPTKGLVGGFEVAGDFVLSAPREEETFRNSSVETARDILSHIRPPDPPAGPL